MELKFESQSFSKKVKSMLKVDFRRMFSMPLFYIMVGVSALIPILVLVMTTAMSGTVDPTTGQVNEMETFTNVWQSIASISGEDSGMGMSLTSMCNINMLYFLVAVLVCLFVAADFRSGYSKNLFTVRSKKNNYVISKSLVGFVGGTFMLLAYFIGAVIGGKIAGLSFDPGTAGLNGVLMCMLSKIFLMAVFVPIYLLMSVAAKQKSWLSLIGAFAVGMLFFMIIPIMTPLDSTILNTVMCLAGGLMFSIGFGSLSNLVLRKTSLV